MVVTKHSVKRTKERLGLGKKSVVTNAEKAMRYGLGHTETKGRLRKYMDALYFRYETANNIRIYHRFVYIFCDDILVTVFHLPRRLNALADQLQQGKTDRSKLESAAIRDGIA